MSFSVLAVCIGNVCRSPLTEQLLATRLGDGFSVSSAGVRALAGYDMHPQVRRDLQSLGVEAAPFAARQLTDPMVLEADLVLTATVAVRTRVLEDVPSALRRTFTVLDFATLADGAPAGVSAGEMVRDAAGRRSSLWDHEHDVPDPIGQGPEVFASVAGRLDEATRRIAGALRRAA
ncbi:hypothetical protein LUZ63_020264 [Rhynchospora breviuscula]|uniref:Phosphotyrosine protein phosphatase I domain-containing protein n=1 Tax=Rhynchospora breviuscula TaxID=2022672 RepID=A0A9P9Z8X0_9POAL|nr:hypothetical protein LUZ63_020264 [Rhynchospora breviuscula]